MEFFQELGSLVEKRWKDESYNEEAFPEVAATALTEMTPSEHVDCWDIIRWVNTTTQLPRQRDLEGRFGDPPVTVYDGPRFYIDVYYWLDGTTSIHQHAFCGAFHVLMGSSILSQYRFDEERRVNAHFLVGNMALKAVELLEKGDVRKIWPGGQYVHSLFHLDRPSSSVVVRTHQSPSGLPQYNYYKPYFAVDPFLREEAMTKKVQCASLLLRMRHPEVDELIGEVLGGTDFHTAFSILDLAFSTLPHDHLERAFGLSTGKQRFDALLEIARDRHGQLADLVVPVFEEVQRQQNLIRRRSQITSSEHRFFLALLLNVSDRISMLDLVRRRFPEENPVTTVVRWVGELANTRLAGSTESNVLGIEGIDEDYLFVLQHLLEGRSLEQIRIAFAEEFSADEAAAVSEELEQTFNAIRQSMLFNAIFLDKPSQLAASRALIT